MTQLERPKRQVLASLMPVKIRNNPLHNDAIPMVVRAGDTLACFANVLAHFGLIPPNADLVVHMHVLGLQQTDFFCPSALSLHSTNQEPQIPSTSKFLNQRELKSDEECRASANLHTNAVIAMENQIRDAQQQWIKHQEDRFSS